MIILKENVKYQKRKYRSCIWRIFINSFQVNSMHGSKGKIDIKNKNEHEANSVAIKINEVMEYHGRVNSNKPLPFERLL